MEDKHLKIVYPLVQSQARWKVGFTEYNKIEKHMQMTVYSCCRDIAKKLLILFSIDPSMKN